MIPTIYSVFTCHPEGSEGIVGVPAQGLTKAELMGELAMIQACQIIN
jgi:hypothetical protein